MSIQCQCNFLTLTCSTGFSLGKSISNVFFKKFLACDLIIGKYRQFTMFMKLCEHFFKVKFIFYLGQHDLGQWSFFKDKISVERSQDHWSSGSKCIDKLQLRRNEILFFRRPICSSLLYFV